jgi:heme/copper-type cytochrome/quinol oxidase subunit 1
VSAGPALAPQRPELVTDRVPPVRTRWIQLAYSSDHKDIGRVLIGASLCFLFMALVEFVLMRLQLIVPQNEMIAPVTFSRLLSVFGPTAVVLFALPLSIGLYTYLLPLQIGARSLAFPRLASLALWLFLAGGAMLYVSFVYTPPEAGVNPLPPLSDDLAFISNNGVDVWIGAVGLAVLGMVLQSINLAVTIARMRAPGMAWRRLPPFAVSGAVSSWLLIVVGPVMLAALAMLEIDRQFNGVFFNAGEGGSPIYFQHLSWIFFTGCYMLWLLLAIGAISDILPTFSGKPLLSRGAVALSMGAIAVIGTLAWMQNMFTASIPTGFLYAAMAAALLLVIPIGLVLFNWLATLFAAAVHLRAPMLFALAAISTITCGLAGELAQAVIPANWILGDTAAATAATGYVLVGGPVLAGLAALHYWFPKLTGRTMGEGLGKLSLGTILVGAHLTFLPMFISGIDGQPADVYRFYDSAVPSGALDSLNLISSIGAIVLAVGIVVSLVNAAVSIRRGVMTGPDPWGADSLEWLAMSPPPPHNFDVVPDVRSAEPLRDIRDAIAARERGEAEPARPGEPVA